MLEDPYHDPDESPKEGSGKRMLIRIVMYPLCICLICLGWSMVFNPINNKSLFSGIGVVAICSYYIYIDLRIIFRKK